VALQVSLRPYISNTVYLWLFEPFELNINLGECVWVKHEESVHDHCYSSTFQDTYRSFNIGVLTGAPEMHCISRSNISNSSIILKLAIPDIISARETTRQKSTCRKKHQSVA
jgi:hypothetical protein